MPKGPLLNNIAKSFTTRDCLGIENVAASISDQICPVVTNVTHRAFYWAFMVWIYYDFYQYSGIKDHSEKAFTDYLKRQDYYFVVATLLNPGSDRANLEGILKAANDVYINKSQQFPFNSKYLQAKYGGMRNYFSGCQSMRFILYPETGNNNLPKLTKEGEKMAIAFEKVIKGTQYYQQYRLFDAEVPESVLKEYGKVINLGLVGFDECKELLIEKLFKTKRHTKLAESAAYIRFLNKEYGVEDFERANCRKILFDHMTPSNKRITISSELKTISNEWEIVVGRQYFSAGIEMIWKYMLEQLNEPYTKQQWISKVINKSDLKVDINLPLSKLIEKAEFDYETRENMIATSRSGNDDNAVINGIKIVLSVYNYFHNRDDFGKDSYFFDYGIESDSISFTEMIECVDKQSKSSIKDFIVFVMDEWIIQQHYITAFRKMLQGNDGYYYEIVDGKYLIRSEFDLSFQAIRLTELSRVMRDLQII